MSRTKARKTFSLTDLREQTTGVEGRKDTGVIDEIPGAYQDLDAVMAAPDRPGGGRRGPPPAHLRQGVAG